MYYTFPGTAIVTLVALLVYVWTLARVSQARGKFGIKAPATTGAPEFERAFRIQQNTLEQLALFLPALWVFAFGWTDTVATVIGAVWVVGRIVYTLAYTKDPEKRGLGFSISFLASAVLVVGALGRLVYLAAIGAI